MKTKKLRLAELSKKHLSVRQMKALKGGDWCSEKCGTKKPLDTQAFLDWYDYFFGPI